jgi:hypothetical protein
MTTPRDTTIIAAAKLFAAAVDHMQEGYDWDGSDLQEICKKSGLIKERLYNPKTDSGMDASEGDIVWEPTSEGQELLKMARKGGAA